MLCSHVKTIKLMAGPRCPTSSVLAQLILRRWRLVSFCSCADFQQRSNERLVVLSQTRSNSFHGVDDFFIWMVWSFSKTFELMAGLCSPKHGPVLFTVLKNHFVWMLNIQVYGWAALPNIPCHGPAHFAALKNHFVWCCADFQQRSNERIIVLPQTQSRSFHSVEDSSHLDGIKLFKNIRTYGWAVLPQTRPSFFNGVEESSCMDVMQPCKNIQVDGWAALPNIPCHGPAHFAALKNHFVLILCRHSTTFKWTDGRAPPNTVERISPF